LLGDVVRQTVNRVADGHGRLHIDVPLGPGNLSQQYTVEAMAIGTRVFSTLVRIQPN
jgi:hypothetical protein